MTSEPIGERVATLEATVDQHDREINGEGGLREFRKTTTSALASIEAKVDGMNWKISFFVGAVCVIGTKLLDFGFGKLVH